MTGILHARIMVEECNKNVNEEIKVQQERFIKNTFSYRLAVTQHTENIDCLLFKWLWKQHTYPMQARIVQYGSI
jgi:hypothetical protein